MMFMRDDMAHRWLITAVVAVGISLPVLLYGQASALDPAEAHYPLKLLGKFLFFDKISIPARQSCASCHAPETGGTNENALVNQTVVAVPGANFHTSSGFKPPTNFYASLIAPFHECAIGGFRTGGFPGHQYCGGNFWDGRSEGNAMAIGPGAAKHIGTEVFQGVVPGDPNDFILAYAAAYIGPISDQALNPMPNPVEQNISRQAVCEHVADSAYAVLYEKAWGEPIDCSTVPVGISAADLSGDELPETEFDISFKRLMLAVGAYQHSRELNSFTSKRDKALRAELACDDPVTFAAYYDPNVCTHEKYLNSPGKFPLVGLTDQENLGHDLFYNIFIPFGPNPSPPPFPDLPVTQCSFCHLSDTAASDGTGLFERYADDAYHNIGTPANPDVPAEAQDGISGHVGDGGPGFFKTATLRNLDKRPHRRFIKAFAHNGWFKSLESIVHFYNTAAIDGETAQSFGITRCPDTITSERRALRANCWPEPEWPGAAFGFLIGDLGMNLEQEAALVAYLKTFTDEETVAAPQPSEIKALLAP